MSFKWAWVLVACGLLSGCGFRPLYGDFQPGSAGERFLEVEIDMPKDREGQLLRNELVGRFYGSEQRRAPRYRLGMELKESKTSLAVKKSAFATRGNLAMSVTFKLSDRTTGVGVFTGSSKVTVSYNILDSEFASLLAEKNARERAIRELSHDIRVRLGSYFDRLAETGR